jgi:hypothetical protein
LGWGDSRTASTSCHPELSVTGDTAKYLVFLTLCRGGAPFPQDLVIPFFFSFYFSFVEVAKHFQIIQNNFWTFVEYFLLFVWITGKGLIQVIAKTLVNCTWNDKMDAYAMRWVYDFMCAKCLNPFQNLGCYKSNPLKMNLALEIRVG